MSEKPVLELRAPEETPNYLRYGNIGYWPAKLRDAKFNVHCQKKSRLYTNYIQKSFKLLVQMLKYTVKYTIYE